MLSVLEYTSVCKRELSSQGSQNHIQILRCLGNIITLPMQETSISFELLTPICNCNRYLLPFMVIQALRVILTSDPITLIATYIVKQFSDLYSPTRMT